MAKQTYQQCCQEVKKELPLDKNLDKQDYFYKLKQEQPERFEALFFDTNSHKPYSEDLQNMLDDLKLAGCPVYKY